MGEGSGEHSPAGGLQFDDLFTTSERDEALVSAELVAPGFDAISGPSASLGLQDVLLALQAMIRRHPAAEELDPRTREVLAATTLPEGLADAVLALTPDGLGPVVQDLAAAPTEAAAALGLVLECKMRLDLAYWAPLIAAGHRGEFTSHARPLGDALQLAEALEGRLDTVVRSVDDRLSAPSSQVVAALRPAIQQVREALPRQAEGGVEAVRYDRPVVAPRSAADRAVVRDEVPGAPQRRRLVTPLRAGLALGLCGLVIVAVLVWSLGGPRDRAGSYDGPGMVEHIFDAGGAVQVTVPSSLLALEEEGRRAALVAIQQELEVQPGQTVTFLTSEGFPVADALPSGELRLVTMSAPPP